MSDKEQQLRQRIKWLEGALAACREHGQREALIERLLDTQDQLMMLKMLAPPAPRRMVG